MIPNISDFWGTDVNRPKSDIHSTAAVFNNNIAENKT